MKIRGYVAVTDSGIYKFANDSFPCDGWKQYTFELNVPHPLPELNVMPESVKEL